MKAVNPERTAIATAPIARPTENIVLSKNSRKILRRFLRKAVFTRDCSAKKYWMEKVQMMATQKRNAKATAPSQWLGICR